MKTSGAGASASDSRGKRGPEICAVRMNEWTKAQPRARSAPVFNFYAGKNTTGRKDDIMDRLAVPAEE
jgi:hypothetical protein